MIKIARKIEMTVYKSKGPPVKYPWDAMEIGDSFECTTYPFSAAGGANKRLKPKHFSVRKYKDGYRCWRDR